MNTKPIIIIGTGRSGTSMASAMLHYLGVYLGERFIPADDNNPTGHFEDIDFAELNRKAVGEQITKEEWQAQTKELIAKRIEQATEAGAERWGWKIPMSTNVLGWYEEMGVEADYLWIDRPVEESVESTMRCYNFTKEQAEKLILPRAEILHEAEQQGVIEYKLQMHEIVKNPKETTKKMIDWFDLKANAKQKRLATGIVNKNENEAKVFVGVCTMGSVHTHLVNVLVQWANSFNINLMMTHNVAPVYNARNHIVRDFLKTDCTHLLFVDDDTIPPVFALKALLKANKDIVTGLTPMVRQDERNPNKWYTMYNAFNRVRDKAGNVERTEVPEVARGLAEIERCGSSCVLIKREVFEKLGEPYYYFDWDKTYTEHTSEDIGFCDRAKEAGFEIYADTNVVCKHSKRVML